MLKHTAINTEPYDWSKYLLLGPTINPGRKNIFQWVLGHHAQQDRLTENTIVQCQGHTWSKLLTK